MVLAFNNNHIIYYHMDAQQSIGLGQTYFTSSDCLVVQFLVCSLFFHLDTINPTGPHVYQYSKIFGGHSGV